MDPTSHGKARERAGKRIVKRRPKTEAESALRQLRKRLKMLRDYHADTLAHRAGDVELAVETVIFEQLMRRSKSMAANVESSSADSLHAVLENVQQAVQQLASHQQNDRQEHDRLMEQYQRLTSIADSIASRIQEQPESSKEIPQADTVSLEQHQTLLDQLITLRKEHDDLLGYLEKLKASEALTHSTELPSDTEEYHKLQRQVQELTDELAKAREESVLQEFVQLSGTTEASTVDTDLCVQKLREQLLQERQTVVELRLEINELNAKLRDATNPQSSTKGLSWDEQKARLLQKLEGETGQDIVDPDKPLEIHAIIERTDREVARRDAEIAELKRLLSEQSTASHSVAIGAAAVAELLDHDDLIREERESLRQLQEQWRLKLREAEIEISMERAKIARERLELEERIKDCEKALSQKDDVSKSSNGSRWLSRLGLSDSGSS